MEGYAYGKVVIKKLRDRELGQGLIFVTQNSTVVCFMVPILKKTCMLLESVGKLLSAVLSFLASL